MKYDKNLRFWMLIAIIGLGVNFLGCVKSNNNTSHESDDGNDSGDDTTGPFDIITDDYGIPWIRVYAGEYTMGCSSGDTLCLNNENPPTVVQVQSFLMMQYEMTNQMYFDIMGQHPRPDELEEKPNYPVHLPIDPALRFFEVCEQAGMDPGGSPYGDKIGRLPTPEEWEYAARAGTTTRYYCGNEPSCLDEIAWWSGNIPAGAFNYEFQPIGLLEPNPWGFYDILGNVWEFIDDSGMCDEESGFVVEIVRGGGAQNTSAELRVSFVGLLGCGYGGGDVGVRCVKDIVE